MDCLTKGRNGLLQKDILLGRDEDAQQVDLRILRATGVHIDLLEDAAVCYFRADLAAAVGDAAPPLEMNQKVNFDGRTCHIWHPRPGTKV